jgi:hypothetical protein
MKYSERCLFRLYDACGGHVAGAAGGLYLLRELA